MLAMDLLRPAARPLFSSSALALSILVSLVAACDRAAPPAVKTSSTSPAPEAPAALPPSSTRLERAPLDPAAASGEAAGVRYLEIVTGGADPSSELPLVMAIHGLGDRPEAFSGVLADIDAKVRLILPRGLTAFSNGYSWFSLESGLESEATSKGILAAADKLAAALAELSKSRPTRGRPIVTGFSQGGALSFAIAVLHPNSVAAAFPVGGWVAFPTPEKLGQGGSLPRITALHGEADLRVPIAPTREAVDRLKKAGMAVDLRGFPGIAHAMPDVLRRELQGLITAAISAH